MSSMNFYTIPHHYEHREKDPIGWKTAFCTHLFWGPDGMGQSDEEAPLSEASFKKGGGGGGGVK